MRKKNQLMRTYNSAPSLQKLINVLGVLFTLGVLWTIGWFCLPWVFCESLGAFVYHCCCCLSWMVLLIMMFFLIWLILFNLVVRLTLVILASSYCVFWLTLEVFCLPWVIILALPDAGWVLVDAWRKVADVVSVFPVDKISLKWNDDNDVMLWLVKGC